MIENEMSSDFSRADLEAGKQHSSTNKNSEKESKSKPDLKTLTHINFIESLK